jgi:adenylate kinase family enzyme
MPSTSGSALSNRPRRINVVGTCGCGKTTVARAIAERLNVPHIELDALFWKADWGETPDEELLPRVDRETDRPAWVLDGNYSRTRGIVWPKADTIVWLDYSFPRVFGQLLRRTIRRAVTREPMWDGCRESFRISFLSRDSILLWCLQTYWKRRRNYPGVLARPEHAHLHIVRLRSRRETARFIAGLGTAPST